MVFMSEGKLIAIESGNIESRIGPLITAKIIIDTNFFRDVSYLELKSNPTIAEIQKNVDISLRHIDDIDIGKVPVDQINKNISVSMVNAAIEALNKTKQFWDHQVFILTPIDTAIFKQMFLEQMPTNLKAKKLNIDKWVITNEMNTKLLKLVHYHYLHNLKVEMDDIKAVWGDFGTGLLDDPKTIEFLSLNKDCPHIRQ